jgi:phytoene desaturase
VGIRLNEEVREVIIQGRKAIGVRTDSGNLECDALVINADFADAMTRLVPDKFRRRWTNRRIEQKKFSCSTFMMYLGLDRTNNDLAHHTIYMAEDYGRNLREIETDHVLSADPSFYVQNACITDPSLAPPGMSTLYVLFPVTNVHPNVNWSTERQRFRWVALRQLEKIGVEDAERRIRFERLITPEDWQHDHRVYRGATFSMAHSLRQMLHLRPHNRFEDLDGVYLVGGGTHPGSGLPVIFESARISARLLLDDLGLDRKWIDVPSSLAVPEYVS